MTMVSKDLEVPPEYAGEEWAGTYTIRELTAPERDRIDEEVVTWEYNEKLAREVARQDTTRFKKLLILAAVKAPKNVDLKKIDECPKMRDLLFWAAEKMNYPTIEEASFLLRGFNWKSPRLSF